MSVLRSVIFILFILFFKDISQYLFFKKNYFIVQLQLSAFTSHPSQTHLPPLLPQPPLGFVHVSFIVVPENPSPHYPLPTPLWLLSDCS